MSQTQPAMAASFAELDGTCNMDATATSTSVQLDSNALYELSPSASMPAELGSDTEEALQSTVMVGRSTERSMVEPLYNFAPLVSPMSSMDQSQPSTHTDDWYTSQSSAISAFPTETSLSLTDDGRSRSAKDFVRPKLPTINTTWLCPPASDQPTSHVTESPEDISAADRLRTETLIGSSQDPTLRSRHYPAELTPPSMLSPGSFDDILMDIDALPEQTELETAWADRHPFILGNAANATATGHRYVSQGGYKGASPSSSSIRYTGTSDEQNAVGRLLAACEDYASILHEDCPNAIVDYLRKIFFSTRSYCQEKYTQSKPIDGVDLEDFWPSEPSIESGLEGLHDLMTEGWSTSHRLVSLLFLSFSLICVSLSEDQDLELAVLCLHQSARSWADFVYDPVEALFLPDFIDNLWELVEHKDLQLHVPSLGQSSNSLQDLLSAYVLGRRDFVLEIATTFIDVTLAAGIRACSQGTQAPNCVVEAPPSYADALHEPVLIPLACEAALEFPGCSTAYTALNPQLDADIATHQPTKPDHVLGILRDHDSQKDPIDTTSLSIRYTPPVLRASFSYLAKASRWMLTTLQRSAHRVASDPVELTPPRRSATAPDILEGVVGGSAHVMAAPLHVVDRLVPSHPGVSRSSARGPELRSSIGLRNCTRPTTQKPSTASNTT